MTTNRGRGPGAIAAVIAAVLLIGGGFATHVAAQVPDRSDVVLDFDFSASILQDQANRNRFGAALEGIAARIDEISSDLVAGDTTVTLVQFATRAADYPGCADLKLLDNAANVAHFADCLRAVAAAYRKGLTTALTKSIGIDTNYVAAMDAAARHLPADATRPAMILFTDGKHDVKGVPVSQVQVTLNQLFGSRSPFALLPVGMGLDPKERTALATGLEGLRIVRAMPPCLDGSTFDWPQVVFETADQAGSAVAVALQDATCTFTAAPAPSSTPAPTPAAVRGIRLLPGDGHIDLSWDPGRAASASVVDYAARCRSADGSGDWIASSEAASTATNATVGGLTNGTAYQCEVAAVSSSGAAGAWADAVGTVTPFGRPGPPTKPSVGALNHAVQISVAPAVGQVVTSYHFECSSDNGGTWPAAADAAPSEGPAQIGNLTNGVDYTCRAFAKNAVGQSDASPLSDAVRPCSSTLECNALLEPILVGVGVLLGVALIAAFVALYRGRTLGHVVAVVDVVHTANIGHGSRLGIGFVRAADSRAATGVVADRGRTADVRIRRLRGNRFEVRDKVSRKVVGDGEPLVVVDSLGVRHTLVLQAFATNAASRVASRR